MEPKQKRTRYADCIRVEVGLLRNPSWIRSRKLRKLLSELICWSRLVFEESASELAITACLADLGSEDEGSFRWADHVVEVRRALGRKSTERPYLARQLSMFYHR